MAIRAIHAHHTVSCVLDHRFGHEEMQIAILGMRKRACCCRQSQLVPPKQYGATRGGERGRNGAAGVARKPMAPQQHARQQPARQPPCAGAATGPPAWPGSRRLPGNAPAAT
eukprot:6783035-Lingulodinium_polyedra.AAC.2